MAMEIGNASLGTGLAGALFTARKTKMQDLLGGDYDEDLQDPSLIALCDADASALVTYLAANLKVKAGIQVDDNAPTSFGITAEEGDVE